MPRQKSTHVDDPKAVARRLRDARERAGLSQRELAFLGCTPAYISRIESGQRIPSFQLLIELGTRLGVSAQYLATGSEAKPESPLADALVEAEVALRLDDPDTAVAIYERVLSDEVVSDPATRSRALEGLGLAAFRAGDPQRTIELLEQALDLSGDQPGQRPALASALARAYALLNSYAQAISLLESCAEFYESDPVQYVRFTGILGGVLTDNGNYSEAERVLARALVRGREVADPYTRARLHWAESRLRSEQGQDEMAAQSARKALEALRVTEDTYAIAQAHQALAHVYLNQGKALEALDLLREGESLMVRSATPIELAQYKVEEARALAALGEAEEAGALAMALLADLEGLHAVDTARLFLLLADVYEQIGDPAKAREVLELAIEILEEHGPSRFLVSAYRKLAEALKAEGKTDEAFKILEQAIGVQERVGPVVS